MRNQFDFYGMKAPTWVPIAKKYLKDPGSFQGEDLKKFTRLCFDEDRREVHYFAIEMVQ